MGHLQLRTKIDLLQDLTTSYANASTRQRDAYALAITLVNSVDDSVKFKVRGVNVGDIGESVLKYHLYGNALLTYSKAGLKDIDYMRLSEVKTFGATNSTPNGTLKPKAFLSVSRYGVHHFTSAIVKQYFKDFKLDTRTGTRAMTFSLLKTLIQNKQVQKLEDLSNALGL
jgi:hypothetical protein